jgi:hypothetical protein
MYRTPRPTPSLSTRVREIAIRFAASRRDRALGAKPAQGLRRVADKLCLMSERAGRGRRATAAQCAEVWRLSREGVPIRRIASEVFGDARFRGRVERILRAPAETVCAPAVDLPVCAAVTAETVPTVRLAHEREVGNRP